MLIIFIIVPLLLGAGLFFWGTKYKAVKYSIQLILLAIIVFLSFKLIAGIEEPIKFQKQKDIRYKAAVAELMQIRKAQVAYMLVKKKYAADFDTLIQFIKYDSLQEVKSEGTIPDSIFLQEGNNLKKAEARALNLGIIIRDTSKVSVIDSLFRDYNVDKLGKVPFHKNVYFDLDTASLEGEGTLRIRVFEAKVTNETLLKGLSKQLIINLSDEQQTNEHYPGLKVGSLEESNNSEGNWSTIYEIK